MIFADCDVLFDDLRNVARRTQKQSRNGHNMVTEVRTGLAYILSKLSDECDVPTAM